MPLVYVSNITFRKLLFTGRLFKINYEDSFLQDINLIPIGLEVMQKPKRYLHTALIRHILAPVYNYSPTN